MNSEVGVPGVVKARYADFLVHEIAASGEVAVVRELAVRSSSKRVAESDADGAAERDVKRARSDGGVGEEAAAAESVDEARQRIAEDGIARISAAIGSDAVEQKMRELVSAVHAGTAAGLSVILPFMDDKARRTAVHHAVRDCFKTMDTDAVPQPVDPSAPPPAAVEKGVKPPTCIRIFPAGPRGRVVRRTKPKWEGGDCDHIRFALHKFNMETQDALEQCARFAKSKREKFSFAGTKDKRGITTQWVTAYKVPLESIAKVNGKIPCLFVGPAAYVKEPLRIGALSGNRFTIVLRNIPFELSEDVIGASVRAWAQLGFINYFGLQRFGTTSVPTHAVGCKLIKGDWKGAVDTILAPRAGDYPDVAKARQLWIDGDGEGAMRDMPYHMRRERDVLHTMVRQGKNEEGVWVGSEDALASLPYSLRTMYCHGYQSYVWNRVVSARLDTLGLSPVVGDLVEIPPSEEQAAETAAAVAAAAAAASGSQARRYGKKVFIRTHVRALTADDIASAQYKMADVLVPLPGYDIQYPPNMLAKYKEIMAEDGITSALCDGALVCRLTVTPSYPLPLIASLTLAPSPPSLPLSIHFAADPEQWKKVEKSETAYTLPGAYRPMIRHIVLESWSRMQYNDGTLPLTLSDAEALSGKEAPASLPEGKLAALKLAFTLPSGTYATMCLRELTKQSTHLSTQQKLNAASASAEVKVAVAAAPVEVEVVKVAAAAAAAAAAPVETSEAVTPVAAE